MKKQVYDFIAKNQPLGIREIAVSLRIKEIEALQIVNELQKEGYICLHTPKRLSVENSVSCYYKTCNFYKGDKCGVE